MSAHANYVVKVLPGPGCSGEYYPDVKIMEGMNVDGVIVLGVKDGKPVCYDIQGVTTMDAAMLLVGSGAPDEVKSLLRQARAIADGLEKANEIAREQKTRGFLGDLLDDLKAKAEG